jgi:hypothetical protein
VDELSGYVCLIQIYKVEVFKPQANCPVKIAEFDPARCWATRMVLEGAPVSPRLS